MTSFKSYNTTFWTGCAILRFWYL